MDRCPILIGDIGGTYARFGVLSGPGEPHRLLLKTETRSHPNPCLAIAAALAGEPKLSPRSAWLAVAGRVAGPVVRLTNADWTIDAKEICEAFDLDEVHLINDYAATAAGLTRAWTQQALMRIGPEGFGSGSRLILGPGTGLGAAAVTCFGSRYVLQPTEAGHIEFGASSETELALWPHLERAAGRITAESVLSGPGLSRLYRGLAAVFAQDATHESAAAIATAGLSGDPLAGDTLKIFVRLLGRFAGDLALVFGATGGVFIGGGIAPRILPILHEGGFRAEFERKAPFAEIMSATPTYVMTGPEPALDGLAVLAQHPSRFLIQAARCRKSRSTGGHLSRRPNCNRVPSPVLSY